MSPSCSIIAVILLTCDPEILQRGGDLETSPASQYPSVSWSYGGRGAVFDGFGLDGKRDDQQVRRERPGCKSR